MWTIRENGDYFSQKEHSFSAMNMLIKRRKYKKRHPETRHAFNNSVPFKAMKQENKTM